MFSSTSSEWETPQALFDQLNARLHFTLDPCATPENAKCKKFYTKQDDGLSKSWRRECVFMNPPYGREIGKWVQKAYEEGIRHGTLVVALLPARTDTRWWHDYVMRAREVWLIRGRLRFGGMKNSAPFPSAIAIFDTSLEQTVFTSYVP